MQNSTWLWRGVALGVAGLLTGCEHTFTYTVWQTDDFRHFREPSANAGVAVFYAPQRKDFLVAYNSVRDDDEKPKRKAYFVLQNEERVADHKKPEFASTNSAKLIAVPVNGATDVFPNAQFDKKLTIRTAEAQLGPYALPIYEETSGVAAKSALMPLAVAGDVTCVGLVLGFIAAVAYAQGGYSTGVP